jgi:flagellar basal body-associated protein FliL
MRGHQLQKKQRTQFHDVASKSTIKPRFAWIKDKKNRRIVIIIAAIVVLISAYVIYKTRNTVLTNTDPTSAQMQAAADLTAEASTELQPQDTAKLADTMERIKAAPHYQSDQNLLYVALQYYINISDSKNARSTYDQLVKVYDAKKGLSPTLGDPAKSLNVFKTEVEFLEAQAKSYYDGNFSKATQ